MNRFEGQIESGQRAPLPPKWPTRWALCLLVIHGPAAFGHNGTIPWLQPDALDNDGLYCNLHGPAKVRHITPLTFKLILLNVDGASDCQLVRIELRDGAGRRLSVSTPNVTLPSQSSRYRELIAHEAHPAESLHARSEHAFTAMQIAAGAHWWSVRLSETEVESLFRHGPRADVTAHITLRSDGRRRTIVKKQTLRLCPPLPTGAASELSPQTTDPALDRQETATPLAATVSEAFWFAGDQHVHTTYSVDTHFPTSGVSPDTVTEFGDAARALGLSWIVITDHSNIHGTYGFFPPVQYYTQAQFDQGTAEAAAYSSAHNDFTLLYSEEMGADTADPENQTPAHLVVFPYAAPSTGFIENPSSGGLLSLNYLNCEPAQVIFDRVNAAGGLGFIAHPFASGGFLSSPIYDAWDDWDATGYAGLEIWSDDLGTFKTTDQQSLAQWYTMLSALGRPRQSPGDTAYPNAFPVGLGNSDAHTTSRVGNTFTYCWMESDTVPQHTDFAGAIHQGRCVASNGPLMFITLNQTRVGQDAGLVAGVNTMTVSVRSSAEFDDPVGASGVGNFVVELWINGSYREDVTLAPDTSYNADLPVPLTFTPGETFITAHLRSLDTAAQWRAYTNPIWFDVPDLVADHDRDGDVDTDDFDAFQACSSGANVPFTAGCQDKDFDGDSDVDQSDFGRFQRCYSGPDLPADPACEDG